VRGRRDDARGGSLTAAPLTRIGVFIAPGIYYLLAAVLHLKPPQIFLAGALLTLAAAVCVVKWMPDSLLRLVLWLLTKTVYRIRVEGRGNVPEKGGALLVCNHVSFVDAPLLMASTGRKIRFIMDKSYYELWWIRPFVGILGIIPIASDLGPRELLKSLQAASDAIRAGEVVCIFAEGKITRTGELNEFQRGSGRIMKNVDAPLVPVALVGVWGSIFSFERGKFLWKWPHRIFYPLTVRFGQKLPPSASPEEIHAAVENLINRRDAGTPG
jgi:acyl-[acyl-carrier-protein]-phospholipid O-acyltransferase/long-chain-fatty-acid--[acyl-carrier-protein] ligase